MQKVSALVFFMLLSVLSHAQEAGKFRGGLKFSPVLTWLKVEAENPDILTIKNEGVKFGFNYGLMGEYAFGKNYALAMELRIAHLGAKYSVQPFITNDSTITRNLSLQYIELPFALKMMTNEIGYAKYFAQFGLVPAINIKAQADITETVSGVETFKEDRNISQLIIPLSSYLQVGAGMEYNLGGNTNLLAAIVFNNGFTNIWKKKQLLFENYSLKPANVALNIGVMF